jgi:hypothetical protein
MLLVDNFNQSVGDLISCMIYMRASSDCTDRIYKRNLFKILVLVWDHSEANFPTIRDLLIKLFNLLVLFGPFEVHIGVCFEVCD